MKYQVEFHQQLLIVCQEYQYQEYQYQYQYQEYQYQYQYQEYQYQYQDGQSVFHY